MNLLSDFNACNDGSQCVADAWDAMVAAAQANGVNQLLVPKGEYRFDRKPSPITFTAEIAGDPGPAGTGSVFLRNFSDTYERGLVELAPGAQGAVLRRFRIKALQGTSGGAAISVTSNEVTASTMVRFEDLYITADGYNAWDNSICVLGAKKTPPSAIGMRLHFWQNVHCHGSRWGVRLQSVVGFHWDGGGIYPGGVGDSGQLTITGTDASPSGGVNIDIETASGLNLSHLNGGRISVVNLGNHQGKAIANDGYVQNVVVRRVAQSGTVDPNWVNSSVIYG